VRGIAMNQIKIDIDNKNFKQYLKWFEFAYGMLRYRDIWFNYAEVFKTKKGFHIYIDATFRNSSKDFKNLIELLMGSDKAKQLYYFAEDEDILFKIKDGKENEKYDVNNSSLLHKTIAEVNHRELIDIKYTRPIKLFNKNFNQKGI
jgi:hypothetical protein